MGVKRSAAVAAMVGGLLLAGAVPASADETAPLAVTATGLTDGEYINSHRYIHPTWTDGADVVEIQIYENGKLRKTFTSWTDKGLLVPVNTFTQNNTTMDVTVRVYAADGTSAEATTTVNIDLTPPDATFTPAPGSYVGGVATLTPAVLTDDVAEVELIDAVTGEQVASATSAPWILTWDTHAHPDRAYPVVTDHAGNYRRYDDYLIDNDGPAFSDPIFYPDVPGRAHGLTMIEIPLTDKSGADHAEWWLNGTLVATNDSKHAKYLDEASLIHDLGTVEGTVHLEVRAWDHLGNESAKTFDVAIDATGPTITSIKPANQALVRGGSINGVITATDPSGIASARLNDVTNAYTLMVETSSPVHVSVPTGADGTHKLIWTVTDTFGNSTTTTRYVIVDNTKPTTKITGGPKNGAKVHGTVSVTASARDRNGIGRVQLIVNGKVVATDTKAGYRFTVNTGKYGKNIKVQVRAYDRAGNVTTSAARTWHR